MNRPRVQVNINPKDVPMEDLKAPKDKIKPEEGPADSPDETSSSERKSPGSPPETSDRIVESSTDSSLRMNGTIMRRDYETGEETTVSPVQERFPARDIRFGDLPQPRKRGRELTEGISVLALFRG